jgi:hypothetical protein
MKTTEKVEIILELVEFALDCDKADPSYSLPDGVEAFSYKHPDIIRLIRSITLRLRKLWKGDGRKIEHISATQDESSCECLFATMSDGSLWSGCWAEQKFEWRQLPPIPGSEVTK